MLVGYDLTTPVSSTTEGKTFGLLDRTMDDAGKEYIYVQANGAITANDVVYIDESGQADQLDLTNSAANFQALVGVSPATFADNEYGWIQVWGACTINVGTSAAANAQLNSTSTAGRVDDDATAGSEDVVGLFTTGTESSNAAAGWLNHPYIGATN